MINHLFAILFGLAGGIFVGCGIVAFLSVLNIIPRLMQLSKTVSYIHWYEWSIVLGVLMSTWLGLRDVSIHMPEVLLIIVGLACGLFVGMLAAAVTEVINVIPLITKRIGMDEKLLFLLMAVVFGKITFSLFQWIYFVHQ